MTDPMNALIQFQDAFAAGFIPLQPGRQDPAILFAPDQSHGRPRFKYMRAQGSTLTVLVMLAQKGLDGRYPVFNIGYAVHEAYRGRRLVQSTLVAALAELTAGLADAGVRAIHVEAVISPDNLASLAVANAVFDTDPIAIVDSESDEPALHYTRVVPCEQ